MIDTSIKGLRNIINNYINDNESSEDNNNSYVKFIESLGQDYENIEKNIINLVDNYHDEGCNYADLLDGLYDKLCDREKLICIIYFFDDARNFKEAKKLIDVQENMINHSKKYL